MIVVFVGGGCQPCAVVAVLRWSSMVVVCLSELLAFDVRGYACSLFVVEFARASVCMVRRRPLLVKLAECCSFLLCHMLS